VFIVLDNSTPEAWSSVTKCTAPEPPRNLAENDGIGLMFVIPGVREVLRVNGRAYPTDEPDVRARMRTEGKDAELHSSWRWRRLSSTVDAR
jgi:hypothetical protein